jgi:hypothetical protein
VTRLGPVFVLVVFFAVAPGCGGESDVEVPQTETPEGEAAPSEQSQALQEELYGTDGQLLASNVTVAGLPLPRGLRPVRELDREHLYLTDVPLNKVQRYFGPRLVTGQVDRLGEGAVYRHATARDAQGALVRMDVMIIPTVSGTQVQIIELPPPPANPPSEEEIRRQINEQIRTME